MSRWGILIFIVAYLIRPLIFFSATVLTILAGAIFGPVLGVLLTILSANAGAMIAYGIGRKFGDSIIDDENETIRRLLQNNTSLKDDAAIAKLMRLPRSAIRRGSITCALIPRRISPFAAIAAP